MSAFGGESGHRPNIAKCPLLTQRNAAEETARRLFGCFEYLVSIAHDIPFVRAESAEHLFRGEILQWHRMAAGLLHFSKCRLARADHAGKKATRPDRQPISNFASGPEVNIRRFAEAHEIKETGAHDTLRNSRELLHCLGRFDERHVRAC